jgi:hypothetical protein
VIVLRFEARDREALAGIEVDTRNCLSEIIRDLESAR